MANLGLLPIGRLVWRVGQSWDCSLGDDQLEEEDATAWLEDEEMRQREEESKEEEKKKTEKERR